MRRPLLLLLGFLLAVPMTARADDWQSLFNGKDLTGWKGLRDLWSVKDAAITGYTKDGKLPGGANSFLVWDGTAADFELKVRFKLVGGNSGIQYRSKYADKSEFFHIAGYQADMDARSCRAAISSSTSTKTGPSTSSGLWTRPRCSRRSSRTNGTSTTSPPAPTT